VLHQGINQKDHKRKGANTSKLFLKATKILSFFQNHLQQWFSVSK